jgi:lipid II:glycine glycyltransferase (peptidoglycan interpeptide bridge formation enzyme)
MMSEALSAPLSATDRWTEWDSFLESVPDCGFMQSSWWVDFRATTGWEHFGAMLKDRHAIVGGAVVMKFSYEDGRCFYYIPEGPALPDDESIAGQIFEAILETIEERRLTDEETVSHLRMEPRWQRLPSFVSGFRTAPSFLEPRNTLCVDLRPSEAAIRAQMKPKGRYNIGVAQRHGVSVVEDPSDQGLADFLAIYQETTTRHGLRGKPPSYFRTLVPMLTSLHRGSVFFAEHEGTRLTAAVVVYFGRRATYFFGGSLSSDRGVMAPYLLHFEIMRRAKAMGHEWYDFWGIAPASDPDHPWQNISVFKRKFGGQELKLVPTLDYVFDPTVYDDFVARYS